MPTNYQIPHTYVISLASAKERRRNISVQLVETILPFTIVNAVDKVTLTDIGLDIYDPKQALNLQRRELTAGEIACVLSHVCVWKIMIEKNEEYALILEDDAIFSSEILEILGRVNRFPDDWSMINLHSDSTDFSIVRPLNENIQIKKFLDKMNRTSAYLIKSSAASQILKYAVPVRKNADGMLDTLRRMGKIICYGTEPQLVSTDEERFPTLIGKR